jgi:hypothetical protein
MKTSIVITTMATLIAMAIPFAAIADIPPPLSNYATIAYEGEVSVFVTFDGSGDPLNACRAESSPPGTTVDATITVTLLDPFTMEPVAGFPAEDFWLATSAGGLILCPGGSQADGPTDENGVTFFTQPLRGGGHSNRDADEVTFVLCNGDPLHQQGFALRFNSADLTGDLSVGLDDVILFCQMYGTHQYHYAIDFYFDGVVNLSDIVYFANNMNTACE